MNLIDLRLDFSSLFCYYILKEKEMKIYYVTLTTNKDMVAKNYSGKRLSLYTKKHEAIKTCVLLNYQWELFFGNGVKEEKPFKVYCVESEPMEVTSD